MAEKKESPAGSSFWQIIFPAAAGTIFVLLICIWVASGVEAGNISRFAELSTVLLILPVLFFSLIILVVLGACVFLSVRMIRGLPPITSRIVEFLDKIRDGVSKFSEIIVQPVIQPTAYLKGFRAIFSREKTRYRIE
jgi:hypothetical protein